MTACSVLSPFFVVVIIVINDFIAVTILCDIPITTIIALIVVTLLYAFIALVTTSVLEVPFLHSITVCFCSWYVLAFPQYNLSGVICVQWLYPWSSLSMLYSMAAVFIFTDFHEHGGSSCALLVVVWAILLSDPFKLCNPRHLFGFAANYYT